MRPSPTIAAVTAVTMLAACTPGPSDVPPGGPPPGTLAQAAASAAIAAPATTGSGSLATTLPNDMRPAKAPAQAGKNLAGRALPTNQWWSSALVGPRTRPLWTHPLAVQVADGGVQISSAPITASANGIVTPFLPALTAGGTVTGVTVTGYGAFHVVLHVALAGGGSLDATVVQGSPLLYLRFHGVAPKLVPTGAIRDLGSSGTLARLEVAGQRWHVVGSGLSLADGAVTAADSRIAVARVPDGVDAAAWERAIAGTAADPVVDTTAAMAYDAISGTVTQTLTARRASGEPGVWALLPHQRAGLVAGPAPLAGSYPDARGTLSLARATAVNVRVPMPGLLPGVPAVDLPAAARTAVLADLDRDLADPPGAGGSYFGLKELARLATVAEVAQGVGAPAKRTAALDRLRPQLVDWLTYSGGSDGRYFGYDKTWGGLIAVPAEFGSQDYNDHHFQYAYLVRAAAVLAAADPSFARAYGDTVDLVVRDYAGAMAVPDGAGGFPPFRGFNAYQGHSAASGYAAFADGNNQESSSEAVAAWEAVARWGLVRNNPALTRYGLSHYALEAATARMYWLGEGQPRAAGYAHTTAGIVWDAKIDYATWFDAKPESIVGIQLLPLTFGSLYRASSAGAAARAGELEKAVGGRPRVWGDLFAADLAVADPAAAREKLTEGVPREESTSRAMVRYYVEALAVLGPPQPAWVAGGPYGLAFGDAKRPTLVGVNPTAARHDVVFRRTGTDATKFSAGAGGTVIQRP
jgi:endo-1,3(4)-beta-glucanase